MAAFLCATAILSCALTARAQISPELMKMAGEIALTKDLLARTKSFLQKVTDDAATKAEFAKMGGEKDVTAANVSSLVSKYPKLSAAFKSASLKPDEFMKVYGVILVVPPLAEAGGSVEDKAAQANVDFYNANKEEVKSVSQSVEALENANSPASSP